MSEFEKNIEEINSGVYAFDPRAFNYTIILYAIGALYFFMYSKNHLVAKTAEEEFAMLDKAESELTHELG